MDVAAVIGCVVIGGLFAAADAAVTALPEARLRALVENASDSSSRSALRRVLQDTDTILARFLVGRVVCLVVAASVGTRALDARAPGWGPIVAAAGVIVLYTLIAEIFTTLVRRRATELAELLLTIVRPFEFMVWPLAAPLALVGRLVARMDRNRATPSDPAENARIAEAEVEYLIEKGQEAGVLEHGNLLQAAVDFKHTVVSKVLVPRTRIVALELKTPLLRVLELISSEGHSRYPIYDGRIDDIIGLLYVKDLFRLDREGKLASTTLADLARKPVLYVQENQEVNTVLKEMRTKRLHMAIVVDEFGGIVGMVTLEDILELLVGDIRDELDEEDPKEVPISDLGNGRLLVDAACPVDELEQRMGVQLPERNGFVSVGGLLMEQLGKVPATGTVVRMGPVDLVVREADERRVRRIEVVRHLPPTTP